MSKKKVSIFHSVVDSINRELVNAVEIAYNLLKKEHRTYQEEKTLCDNVFIVNDFFKFVSGMEEMKRLTKPFIYTLPSPLKEILLGSCEMKLKDKIDYSSPISPEEKGKII